jgi:aminopeptidase-like protein
MGGQAKAEDGGLAMLWVLNFSDGDYSLLDIAEKSGLPFSSISAAAEALLEHHLLAVKPA